MRAGVVLYASRGVLRKSGGMLYASRGYIIKYSDKLGFMGDVSKFRFVDVFWL